MNKTKIEWCAICGKNIPTKFISKRKICDVVIENEAKIERDGFSTYSVSFKDDSGLEREITLKSLQVAKAVCELILCGEPLIQQIPEGLCK